MTNINEPEEVEDRELEKFRSLLVTTQPAEKIEVPLVSWTTTNIIIGLIAALGCALSTVGSVVAICFGIALAFIAIPYTVVAMVVHAKKRVHARRLLAAKPDIELNPDVINFETRTQRFSFTTSILLFVCFALTVVGSSFGGTVSLIAIIALIPLAVTAISVNSGWLYRRDVYLSEVYALATKAGKWKMIRANHVMAYATWIGGCLIPILFFLTQSF